MLPDVELAVRLQALDFRIAGLSKEIAALPKHIEDIEKKLGAHERRLDIDRAALIANQKDRKKFDVSVQDFQAKISKLRDQTLGAKTNEQYRAFQNEIEFCEREIRACEDQTLELMGSAEALDKNVKTAEASLKEERGLVEAEKLRAQKRTAADKKRLEELQTERKTLVAQMTPAFASNYERIRKSRAGIAISEAVDGRCSQCHITLRPQFLQELKRGEKMMTCESCARILYINPPKSPEDLAGVNALSSAS
jgi:predicted  nucleic acid-binding Zn-ribbon protein